MRNSVVRSCIKALLFACCLMLLVWMVIQAGPAQLWQTLMDMPFTIIGCVVIWGIGYLLNMQSFRQILYAMCDSAGQDHNQLTGWQILRLTISGYAINYITPFGLLGGEPYRIIVLRPILGTEKATQSVVLYSMMHMASHFCLWLLSVVLAIIVLQEISADHWIGLAGILFGVAILLILFGYLYRNGIMLRFMRRWVDWPLLNPSLLPFDRFINALGFELISRLVNVIEYWLIMQALGFNTFGYIDALLVVAFSSLFANLLFFSPLQMGTREGGILLALQYLVPSVSAAVGTGASLLAVAVALSFATRLREFIWIALGLLMVKMSGTLDKENSKN